MKHTRVLRYVNRIRRELGAEPLEEMPKGIKGSPGCCPIAKAIPCDATVSNYGIDTWRPGATRFFNTDDYVAGWIRRFDAGAYPDLIKTP